MIMKLKFVLSKNKFLKNEVNLNKKILLFLINGFKNVIIFFVKYKNYKVKNLNFLYKNTKNKIDKCALFGYKFLVLTIFVYSLSFSSLLIINFFCPESEIVS